MILSIEEAKKVAKEYEGIDIHGKKIRIAFKYEGARRFETLKATPLTKANIKSAWKKRIRIEDEIENGKFSYIKEFPYSAKAKEIYLSNNAAEGIELRIYLEKAREVSKFETREKSHKTYESRIDNFILPKFATRTMESIRPSEITEWIQQDLCHLANKTIGDVLTPLRAAYRIASDDQVISNNPLDSITNPKKKANYKPDPFTFEEINKLENTETDRQIELLTALFGMYTGLRPSELLAIAYDDIDFDTWELRVQRGIVQGVFSYTKNNSSERTIELLDNAIEVLKKLLQLRGNIQAKPVTIVDEDNRTERKEDLKLLFVSSKSGSHWSGSESFGKMFFKPHCEASSVRYRAIGQARHTYGSHMMTLNLSLKWIADQMGHSSITMLEKHYGKFMRAKGEKWHPKFQKNGNSVLWKTVERNLRSLNKTDPGEIHSRQLNNKKARILLIYGLFCLVRKAGLEPARAMLTTPSRWRVYQFHHFREILNERLVRYFR